MLFAAVLLVVGLNMLYVAFTGFVYSLAALWLISGFTQIDESIDYEKLTYTPWWQSREAK